MKIGDSKIVKDDIAAIAREISDVSDQLSGKTVLISGGAGFLGKYLVLTLSYLNEHVLRVPCKIIILDNFISGLKESLELDKNTVLIQQDISKPFKIDGPVDYVFHAASIASPVFYHKFRLETIDVGILGTRNMLELAREKNVKSFLFFSSSEVYGNPDPAHIPTNEEYLGYVSCTGPRACYDEPKRIGETLCVNYADVYNLPIKIVRPFNTFGPGMRFDDGRVVPNFVVAALKGDKIPLHGKGVTTRTFCYISDATTGYFKVLLSDRNKEIFNVGCDDQEITMKHLADIVLGLVENDESRIHDVEKPLEVYTKGDPDRRCPDLTKIRTMLGYTPKVSLVAGLKRFIAWAKPELEAQGGTYKIEKNCRVCGNGDLKKIISFGRSPLANNLISEKDASKQELFPLDVMYCNKCHLCQLSYVASPEKMFKHYVYVSSTTETFKKHFKQLAEKITMDLKLKPSSLVVDLGSNDGLLLGNFKNLGVRVVGVEPAENLASLAREAGIDTVTEFFNDQAVEDIIRMKGKADVITANNVFAHVGNIKDFTSNVKNLLKDDGVFCIEVQYLFDSIRNLTFDNIYHEHLSYFTLLSLREFFKREGMTIFNVEHVETHGGSLRVFVQKEGGKFPIDASVERTLRDEITFGLDKLETYEKFASKIYATRDNIQQFIKKLKSEGKRIAGYGAPAKATTLLNFCEINKDHIDYIIEDNPLKQGLLVPGVNIPIVNKTHLDSSPPDYLVILAWNFAHEIMKNNSQYQAKGVKFFVPLPVPTFIESKAAQTSNALAFR